MLNLRLSACFLCLAALSACGRNFGERTNVLKPDGGAEVRIMDFSRPPSLDPISPGWYHRKFFWHGPMQIEFVKKDGRAAVKLTTHDSASMLARYVDIDLEAYPMLSWQWYIEEPIESEEDETTHAGDDQPARFFLLFETDAGDRHAMEIIWGNKLKAGDYKYIGSFPHYVARGGDENIRRWFREDVDLLKIYRHLWKDRTPAHLTLIALFCDSDNTGARSVSYFADVRMHRAPPPAGAE